MKQEIICGGFGGQGVLLLGTLLAEAAMIEGQRVTWIPAYGPEMRGGTCNCTVVVSDKYIGSPVSSKISSLIAFNELSLVRFADGVRPGGTVVYNDMPDASPKLRDDVTNFGVPAEKLMKDLPQNALNMLFLGAFIECTKLVGRDAIEKAMQSKFTGSKAKFIDTNLNALDVGIGYARENFGGAK